MKLRTTLALAAAPLCAASLAGAVWAAPAPADAVFVNGKVFTADAGDHVVQGFAVKGGRFVAVGTSAAVRAYVGPKTTVVDLKGRFVSPGLTDNHFHNQYQCLSEPVAL